jgi:hypothetical protein
MPTRTLLVRQDKHEVNTLHDRRGRAMPEKCPLPESSHCNGRSIFRESRRPRRASLKFRFLVEKIMEIDARPPTETVVSPLGLILAAYDSLADSSRCQPFSAEDATLTWAVVLGARGLAALLPGPRGKRDIPRKSFSSK